MKTISNYYYTTSAGPPDLVVPKKEKTFLPHNYYLSIVISELCVSEKLSYRIPIDDIIDRLDHLITYVHETTDIEEVTRNYFDDRDNLMDKLENLEHSGLIQIQGDYVEVTISQLDYMREYLLDFHNLDV